MARKIIILEKPDSAPSLVRYRFAMWATVPLNRQAYYANPQASSAVKNITAFELADLQAGRFVERVREEQWRSNMPFSEIQAALVEEQKAFQAEIDGYNPWPNYGTAWDGSVWTLTGSS